MPAARPRARTTTPLAPPAPVDPLVETWAINDRVTRYLVAALADDDLALALAPKHRTIRAILAHLHAVRRAWIAPSDAALAAPLASVPDDADVATIIAALDASGAAMTAMLADRVATGTRPSGFRPHTAAFVGHHRAQVIWTRKAHGRPLPKTVAFGLWEWGTR